MRKLRVSYGSVGSFVDHVQTVWERTRPVRTVQIPPLQAPTGTKPAYETKPCPAHGQNL